VSRKNSHHSSVSAFAGAGLDRRRFVAGAAALVAGAMARPAGAEERMAAAAFDPGDIAGRCDKALAARRLWNLHGVVVMRDGGLLFERYFTGADNARGEPLGTVAFGPETLHDLRSVTKSVVGLLYGIALAQGKVPPPETPLYGLFPQYAALGIEAGRDRITLHHVLSMTMGLDWDETSLPYSDPANSEIAMDRAPDRLRYVLARAVVEPPGQRWTYCGGATALLGRLIATGTGEPLHAYARRVLFDPLGLGRTDWLAARDGEAYAASGLRMTPRDLARIGAMMATEGRAGGVTVVPADWLRRITTPVIPCDEMRRYGYQWYLSDIAYGPNRGWSVGRLTTMWMAQGVGGQRLFVMPALGLVVAITAGNYRSDDQWIPPTRMLREVVLGLPPR
jgi:CubicO group peptidase (beta-lactamase class C family)